MNEATRKQNRLDRDRFLSHVDLDDTVGFPAGTVLLTLELGVGYTQTYRLTPDEDGDYAYDRQGILCFRTDEGEHRINLKAGTVAAWHEHTVTQDSPWFNGFSEPDLGHVSRSTAALVAQATTARNPELRPRYEDEES